VRGGAESLVATRAPRVTKPSRLTPSHPVARRGRAGEDFTDASSSRAPLRVALPAEPGSEEIPIPFSRGCSFVRVDASGRIVYARDTVEPVAKPGASAVGVINVIAPILRRTGPVDPARVLRPLPFWGVYAAYWWFAMLDPSAPGEPLQSTPPETVQTVLHESINFGFVNPIAEALGYPLVPGVPAENPVSEATFNFVALWGLGLLPVMLSDPKTPRRVPTLPLWVGTWFLTNLFLTPYMALREGPKEEGEDDEPRERGPFERAVMSDAGVRGIGAFAGALGLVSVWWFFFGRSGLGYPEGAVERAQEFVRLASTQRVDYAFVFDLVLFSAWQAVLMSDAPDALRKTPFFGLVAWLLQGMPGRAGVGADEADA